MEDRSRLIGTLMEVIRAATRTLLGADGITFVIRDGEYVHYLAEDAVGPLWKGERFRAEECVSGWVMTHNKDVSIPDVYADPRVLHAAYRRTFVRSMAMVPLGTPAFAAIGAYWATPHQPTDQELTTLRAIADSALLQASPETTRT